MGTWLVLLLLALQNGASGASSSPFRLRNELGEPALSAETVALAEAAARIAHARLGVAPSGRPSFFRLYPDFPRFRAATAELNPDAPEAWGFTNRDSRTAHVAVQPCATATLQAAGLPLGTRRLIAHEAAHLACFDVLPQLTQLPGWVVEGLADSVAHETLRSLGLADALEQDPHGATRLHLLHDLLAAKRLPPLRALLSDRMGTLGFEERYAARWLALEFLRARAPDACRRLLHCAFAAVPRASAGERFRSALAHEWDAAELATLDTEFVAYLCAFRPAWRAVHGTFGIDGSALRALAPPNGDALLLHRDAFTAAPFHVQGRLRILPGTARQLHVVLAHGPESFHVVAFSAGWGVTVWRHDVAARGWVRLGEAAYSALGEQELAFRIAAGARGLTIALEGTEILSLALPSDNLLGSWGLGARPGSCVEWRELAWEQGT